ncbi:uncharacterized protein FOMMEDRAFT_78038 [Fomitiporia mediterranea MF3/22]|uniref:uncharacterized protein n=1 Tax=Fomitiporia mediterranea (strain MF3/22) TaxID=694068 RepID=UPI00044087BB|nr:uncharacterized protein FOMMEDRAFT_78038 [Fomitiporia mediterranea MF3/22]EJD05672.1 hypothetical protein FOMMEDRAFT_78038 [Fomitiporia mediterranea MF3/22]
MVSGTLVDALVSPSRTVEELYTKACKEGKTNDLPVIVREHFSSIFAGNALDQIPLLNTVHPPSAFAPNSLVRFRAMVQDTSCSPEMYLCSSNGLACAGWGLDADEETVEQLQAHADSNALRERDVLWAVNIPGEGHWCDSSRNTPGATSQSKSHKFPLPDAAHIAIQLKIYDNTADSLKPTNIHEFIGVLTSEPVHSEFAEEYDAPTLHIIFHRTLPKTMTLSLPSETESLRVESIRDSLLNWMSSEAFGGDHDAAEWILLSCLSSVESRNPPLFPLSVTLSELPKPDAEDIPAISHVLSELLSLYFLLPLSLKLLNERSFVPESKDEDLHAGILQVPSDTTIVVTETGIAEGSLAQKGIENVQALQEVAKLQTLQYKFPFSQYSFPTDIKFITVTEGKKSLFLDSNITIPIRSKASSDLYKGKESINWPSPETLYSFRDYIVRAKSAKVTVGEQLSEHIKNDFVRERQKKGSITPDDLTRWMMIARLISLSKLEGEMTMETWNAAKDLDARRQTRLR